MIEYSFIVPIYKDASLAEDFCIEFEKVFQNYLKIDKINLSVEVIFVMDHIKNEDFYNLKDLITKYTYIKIITLSRNFGQHIAVSCGYHYASGKYVGMLNVDMQDPPDQIPLLLAELLDTDAEFVCSIREKRKSGLIERATSYLFNQFFLKLTGFEYPLNVGTLRIMKRKFLNIYNLVNEKNRFLPGLEEWIGFKKSYVLIRHQERKRGKSSYNIRKRLAMAVDSVISFSDLPLKIMVMTGFIISIISFLFTLYLILMKLFFIDFQHGFIALISSIVFFSGLIIMSLGITSLYIGRILKEVQNRPLYVVDEMVNF